MASLQEDFPGHKNIAFPAVTPKTKRVARIQEIKANGIISLLPFQATQSILNNGRRKDHICIQEKEKIPFGFTRGEVSPQAVVIAFAGGQNV